jgi:hypothetical protein
VPGTNSGSGLKKRRKGVLADAGGGRGDTGRKNGRRSCGTGRRKLLLARDTRTTSSSSASHDSAAVSTPLQRSHPPSPPRAVDDGSGYTRNFVTVHGVAESRVRDPERLQTSAGAPYPSGEKLRSQDSSKRHSPKRASAAARPDIVSSISPLRPRFPCRSCIHPIPRPPARAHAHAHRTIGALVHPSAQRDPEHRRAPACPPPHALQRASICAYVPQPSLPTRANTTPSSLARSCSHYPNEYPLHLHALTPTARTQRLRAS